MAKRTGAYQNIERSIIKKFRKEIWRPFIEAVQRYELVNEGDKIASVFRAEGFDADGKADAGAAASQQGEI